MNSVSLLLSTGLGLALQEYEHSGGVDALCPRLYDLARLDLFSLCFFFFELCTQCHVGDSVCWYLLVIRKLRHARGGRGLRMCDGLWRREGVLRHLWRHTYFIFNNSYESLSVLLLLWCLTVFFIMLAISWYHFCSMVLRRILHLC